MKSTLLTVGDLFMDDVKKAPSINRFLRYRNRFERKRIAFLWIPYDDILLHRLPEVRTKRLKIMLFFPYAYWNNDIERYDSDDRIYGDHNFGRDFRKYLIKIGRMLESAYADKDIEYVNPPESCVLDRDKAQTTKLLKQNGITTPRLYRVKNTGHVEDILDKAGSLYIKPPFGSMGKGISVITKRALFTNFIYRHSKIVSRPFDYNWTFRRISGRDRKGFLKILIKRRFVFEEAIQMPVVKGRRFDIRAHVIYGKLAYLFARSVPEGNLVTNWSQGGRMETDWFLKRTVPSEKLEEIEYISKKTAKVTGLNYTGIDVITHRGMDKVYILEVHSFPGYVRKFNLMRFLADEIK